MIDPLSQLIHRGAGVHGPVILMYHSVTHGSGVPEWPWAVSMRRFREQLSLLAGEGWSTPTLSEIVAAPASWQGRTAVITFDDGYADNLASSEELLRRDMRATCFVVSGAVGREPMWPSRGRPRQRMLDARELRELHAMGIEVGSHSVAHMRLTDLDDEGLAHELRESKAAIEDHVGSPCTTFAYPHGASDARCAAAVRQAGYVAACTTRSGWAFRDDDPYQLRRLTVLNSDSASSLARKLSFGDNDAGWTRALRHAGRRLSQKIGIR